MNEIASTPGCGQLKNLRKGGKSQWHTKFLGEASGLRLDHGPRLREGGDPLLRAHLEELVGWLQGLAAATAGPAPAKSADFAARAAYVAGWPAEVGS